jgi:hypothetical protein
VIATILAPNLVNQKKVGTKPEKSHQQAICPVASVIDDFDFGISK